MDRRQLVRSATEVLEHCDGDLLTAYLYGSFARGSEASDSDVDIGVLLDRAPLGKLDDLRFGLEGDLERALGRRTQVVVLNQAPPDLVHRVLRDGRILLDRDRGARIRFEVRARNEYFDLLPILERYRRPEAVRT